MDSQQLKFKVKHFVPYVLGRYKKSGLQTLPKDEKDFNVGSIFWEMVWYYLRSKKSKSMSLKL